MADKQYINGYLVEFHLFSGYEILAYVGEDEAVTVPTELNGERVTRIGSLAFSPRNPYISEKNRDFLKNSLKSVKFNEAHLNELIQKDCIGSFAFAGCQGLTSVVNTDFLSEFDGYRYFPLRHAPEFFYPDCPQLALFEKQAGEKGVLTKKSEKKRRKGYSLLVSGAYHTVGKAACMKEVATSLYIAEGVETIEAAAFAGIQYLENVYLPTTLRYVAPNAFEDCPSLSEESREALAAYITPNPLRATLAYSRSCHRNSAKNKSQTYELTVNDVDESSDFMLLELSETEATVYLPKPDQTLLLPLGKSVSVSYRDIDLGSIIEDERYYERDDTYEYTFTLLAVQ